MVSAGRLGSRPGWPGKVDTRYLSQLVRDEQTHTHPHTIPVQKVDEVALGCRTVLPVPGVGVTKPFRETTLLELKVHGHTDARPVRVQSRRSRHVLKTKSLESHRARPRHDRQQTHGRVVKTMGVGLGDALDHDLKVVQCDGVGVVVVDGLACLFVVSTDLGKNGSDAMPIWQRRRQTPGVLVVESRDTRHIRVLNASEFVPLALVCRREPRHKVLDLLGRHRVQRSRPKLRRELLAVESVQTIGVVVDFFGRFGPRRPRVQESLHHFVVVLRVVDGLRSQCSSVRTPLGRLAQRRLIHNPERHSRRDLRTYTHQPVVLVLIHTHTHFKIATPGLGEGLVRRRVFLCLVAHLKD